MFSWIKEKKRKESDPFLKEFRYASFQVKNFKDFIELYVKDKVDENGQPIKLVHEVVSDRWEIAVCLSEKGYQQVSFVNSIATTKVCSIPYQPVNLKGIPCFHQSHL